MGSAIEKLDKTIEPLDINLGFFSNAVNSNTQGGISGITECNFNICNFSLSMQTTMAKNYAEMLECLPIYKRDITKIIFSGGVALKNEYLRNRVIEMIGNPIADVAEDETFKGLDKYIKIDLSEKSKEAY